MENPIIISNINDFIFCPISIYYHHLEDDIDKMMYQDDYQLNGSAAHEKVDNGEYADSKHILQGIDVYCDQYGISGKIDIYDSDKKMLTERKNKIKQIFDGYVFQLYAQCFAMREMGYTVNKLKLYSYSDNISYPVELPEDDTIMFAKFVDTVETMKNTEISKYKPTNIRKCENCIYEPFCDRSLKVN